MMAGGTVPGNKNADNIDESLAASDFLLFPNRTIETAEIKAFSVTSFGFGQKGAQVIGVHPKYLYATISEAEYSVYGDKLRRRRQVANRYFQDAFYGNKIVAVKSQSPYADSEMEAFLINSEARLA
jgi:fatty acid synthase subunit alpha, fungi type